MKVLRNFPTPSLPVPQIMLNGWEKEGVAGKWNDKGNGVYMKGNGNSVRKGGTDKDRPVECTGGSGFMSILIPFPICTYAPTSTTDYTQ